MHAARPAGEVDRNLYEIYVPVQMCDISSSSKGAREHE